MSAHDGFTFSEARFANALGVSRSDLKSIREKNLEKNVDWKRVAGGEIGLTRSALKRLWKKLPAGKTDSIDLASCVLQAPPERHATIPMQPLDAARQMRVSAIPLNPFIVLAEDEHGQVYRVLVARNSVFARGIEISARPDPNHADIWMIVGPVPRWPGDRAYRADQPNFPAPQFQKRIS